MTKIGKNKLRLSSGKVVKFKSSAARDRYERVAEAIKHGWKPTGKKADTKRVAAKKSSKPKSARKAAPKRRSAKRMASKRK